MRRRSAGRRRRTLRAGSVRAAQERISRSAACGIAGKWISRKLPTLGVTSRPSLPDLAQRTRRATCRCAPWLPRCARHRCQAAMPAACAAAFDVEGAADAVAAHRSMRRAHTPSRAARRPAHGSSRRCANDDIIEVRDQLDAGLVVVAASHIRHRRHRSPAAHVGGSPSCSRSTSATECRCRSDCSDWR